jgi:hypothetical protein
VFVGKMANKNVWKEIHNATIEKYSFTTHGFKIMISHFISHEILSEIVVLVFLQHQIKEGDF